MYKPKFSTIAHAHHSQNGQNPLPLSFTVLAWNLQKVDFSHFIHRPIENLLSIQAPHILSLQEAKTVLSQNKFFNLPFAMAPNIETAKKHFGVVTASSATPKPLRQCLTQTRECGWMTHKTALITQHKLTDNQTLIHVNIHAINFVTHALFNKELRILWVQLAQHQGPMIVSGDFNTWNTTRLKILFQATQQLNLQPVPFTDSRLIKTLLRQPLDHIFYRGLQLQDYQRIRAEFDFERLHTITRQVFAILTGQCSDARYVGASPDGRIHGNLGQQCSIGGIGHNNHNVVCK